MAGWSIARCRVSKNSAVKRSASDRFDRSEVPKHLLIVLAGHTGSLALTERAL